jgi:hypothetical protein
MALSIVWNEGIDKTCRPGSLLSGDVRLLAAKQQPLGQVAITFAGRCKVRIERSNGQSTTYYYSKGYYFRQRQQLHEGDFTFQAGTYRWPFRFIMPACADRGLIQSQNGKGDMFEPVVPWRGTNTEELHLLPPSFNGPRRCSVEYYLKAEMTPPRSSSSLFSRSLEDKVMLNFRPLGLAPSLDQTFRNSKRRFSIRTLKLLPEDSEERHSFRHRLKGVFQSSSLPELNLQVEVSIPRRVAATPGTPFPCLVSVSHCATVAEDTRQVPQSSVQIRRFELELRSHTEARTRYHKDHKREKIALGAGSGTAIRIQNVDHTYEKTKSAYGTDQGGAIVTTDLASMHGVRIPSGVTSDFSTYNIAHYHTFELKLRLECAGEGMNFDMTDLRVEIMAGDAGQDPPTWEQSYGNGSMSIEGNSDMVSPPSYTHKDELQSSSNPEDNPEPYSIGDWE